MTRTTKVVLLTLSYLAVLGLGGLLGFLWHQKMTEAISLVDEATVVTRYAAYLDMQRTFASDREYKEALLAYLEALERASQHPSVLFTERTYHIDRTLTLERLSRVAERMGETKEAEDYLHAALEACTGTGWRDCSKDQLRSITTKMEANSMFGERDGPRDN